MKTILVTGSRGFFASRFIDFYKDSYNVVGLDHKAIDITNEAETIRKIKELNPDFVVHAAAISDTGICQRDPELSYAVNVKGSINIALGCAEANSKLIYLSSDQVYNGNAEEGPYDEEIIVSPSSVYGNHKLEAENKIAKIVDDAISLRLTWLFGLPERNKKISSNIVWNIVRSTINNEAIKLPHFEYRGLTYVYELIRHISDIFYLPKGVYNAGSENDLSTYEAGRLVLKEMGLSHRLDELLIKDIESYKANSKDLRISNKKLAKHNIHFASTEESIINCIRDYSYKLD